MSVIYRTIDWILDQSHADFSFGADWIGDPRGATARGGVLCLMLIVFKPFRRGSAFLPMKKMKYFSPSFLSVH